jgi:hypothetical protein
VTTDRYSVAGLARFADTIRTLTDRTTWATNLGTAIRTVLRHTHLPPEQDVRDLDVDAILATFAANARDDLSPTSISTYDTTFRKAVRRFVAYTDGLRSWDRDERPAQSTGAHLLAHALQLRPDVTVRLRLPADLTAREARRLTRLIDALVDDPTPTDHP